MRGGGGIWVTGNWKRLAVDVTHYRGAAYLSVVDCGPGRIAIWRQLKWESADEIASILNEIFLERGPVEELLMDNATVFRSQLLKTALDNWSVRRFFRAAYRPSGNGIVERHHRTIKAMAERGSISPWRQSFGKTCHQELDKPRTLSLRGQCFITSGDIRLCNRS